MILTVGYSSVKVTGAPDLAHEIIRKKCTIVYETIQKLRGGGIRRKQCFIQLYKSNIFPIGYLPYFENQFTGHKIEYQKLDNRVVPKRDSRLVFKPEIALALRDYQKYALLSGKRNGHGFFKHPTGSGKTYLAAGLINAAGCRTLYIVPNLELLKQTTKEFKTFFGDSNVGMIGQGNWSSYQPILVATVQSLWSQFHTVEFSRSFDNIGMIIGDEIHHVNVGGSKETGLNQNTWYKILVRVPAYYRFGLTATPGDDSSRERKLLEAATGPLLHTISAQELVEKGFLVKPKIIFYRFNHHRRYKNWAEAKEKGLSQNEVRNNLIKTIALTEAIRGKRVLITTDRKETHGYILYKIIGKDRAVYADGDSSKEERALAKQLFESGAKRILIGTLYNEGVNMPKMDMVINSSGGKSARAAVQKFGRALRKAEGKITGVMIDFYDVDEKRFIYDKWEKRNKWLDGVLSTHSEERVKAYEKEGFYVEFRDI